MKGGRLPVIKTGTAPDFDELEIWKKDALAIWVLEEIAETEEGRRHV